MKRYHVVHCKPEMVREINAKPDAYNLAQVAAAHKKSVALSLGAFTRALKLIVSIALLTLGLPSLAQEQNLVNLTGAGDTIAGSSAGFAQNHFYLGYRYLPTEEYFMDDLLRGTEIPTLNLRSFVLSLGNSFYRDWWFADLNFSLVLSEERGTDSLRSRLDQNSLEVRFGYNLIRKSSWLISPYLGLRRTTYLHLTFAEAVTLDLDSYLEIGELDLRISQWTAALGLQTRFLTQKGWSVGLDAAYQPHLHQQPIIRGEENRIRHNENSPLGQFTMGLNFSSFWKLNSN